MISYEDFSKIELKVAKVRSAEQVEGSDKLIKLILEPDNRQVIAGIGKAYEPETLVGKEIIIVANLEPRKLMGLESNGMLLAASGEDGAPVILIPEREVGSGASIK